MDRHATISFPGRFIRTAVSAYKERATMASHRNARDRRKRSRFAPRLEVMEERSLMAAAVPGVTLDPLTVPKFVNTLDPNFLALGNTSFVYQTTDTTTVTLQNGNQETVPLYHVGAYQITRNLLGPTDTNGKPLPATTVYGYGPTEGGPNAATYPGRSFVIPVNPITNKPQPIAVQWTNGLTSQTHVVQAVDTTVPGLKNSVPAVDPTVLDPADNVANG